jgi:hypothetical protein
VIAAAQVAVGTVDHLDAHVCYGVACYVSGEASELAR